MKQQYLKSIISKIMKQSDDMGLFRGDVAYKNRNLNWHRLHRSPSSESSNEQTKRLNQYNLHGLPEMAVNVYQGQMERFRESYQNFALNSRTGKPLIDFNTMTFTIYAEDRLLDNDVENSLATRPDLQEVAKFVDEMAIRLPPIDNGDNSKSIGSNFWFSHFGYAWQQQFPEDVQKVERFVPFGIYPYVPGKHDKLPHGKVVVGPTARGHGLFLSTSDGQMVPLYQGQTPEGFKKYFNKMLFNQSFLYAPQGANGPIEQALSPKVSNDRLREMYSTNPAEARKIEDAKRKFEDRDNIWIFGLDKESGTLLMFKTQGRGSLKSILQQKPLSPEQIRNIVTPVIFEKEWTAITERGSAGQEREVSQGPYNVSDRLKNNLMNQNNPIGIPRMIAYRNFCEQIRGEDLHTPLEGYKIITVGPIFSNPNTNNSNAGMTTTTAPMANPMHQVNPQQVSENVDVIRGLKWLLLANEIQEPRLLAQGRNRLFPSKGAGGGGIHEEYYPTAKAAIQSMISKYLESSMERGETKHIISEGARSVEAADKALRNAMLEESRTNNITPVNNQSVPNNTSVQPPQQNITGTNMSGPNIEQFNQTFSSLKSFFKKKGINNI